MKQPVTPKTKQKSNKKNSRAELNPPTTYQYERKQTLKLIFKKKIPVRCVSGLNIQSKKKHTGAKYVFLARRAVTESSFSYTSSTLLWSASEPLFFNDIEGGP